MNESQNDFLTPSKKELQDISKKIPYYKILKTKDGFKSILPKEINRETEKPEGIIEKNFATEEKALTETLEEKRKNIMEIEKISLAKTYDANFKIEELNGERYEVQIPYPIFDQTGKLDSMALTHKEFNSWEEAKNFYLTMMRSVKEIFSPPSSFLEIGINPNEKVAFTNYDDFNPFIVPSQEVYVIPQKVTEEIMNISTSLYHNYYENFPKNEAITYLNTTKEKNWQEKLFPFILSYCQTKGVSLLKELNIKKLDCLTPKQAIDLSTLIVINLTKYYTEDCCPHDKPVKADKMTVLEVLEDGLKNKDNPNWSGNGVCCTFTSSVKAVFECLKANQTSFSKLNNSYCLYSVGYSDPLYKIDDDRHAWNTFLTISEKGETEILVTEVTWPNRNLDTGELIKQTDYTLIRTEPILYNLVANLEKTNPEKENIIKEALSYYFKLICNIEKPFKPEIKRFYLNRALKIISDNNSYNNLPDDFLDIFYQFNPYQETISKMQTLWHIAEVNKNFNFSPILKEYLDKKLSLDCFSIEFSRAFITPDEVFQKELFFYLKKNNYLDKIAKNPRVRVRIRKVAPELLENFSPATNKDDYNELAYLISSSSQLAEFKKFIGDSKKNSPNELVKEINKFYNFARQNLKYLFPDYYDKYVKDCTDYQIIRDYDEFYYEQALKKNSLKRAVNYIRKRQYFLQKMLK